MRDTPAASSCSSNLRQRQRPCTPAVPCAEARWHSHSRTSMSRVVLVASSAGTSSASAPSISILSTCGSERRPRGNGQRGVPNRESSKTQMAGPERALRIECSELPCRARRDLLPQRPTGASKGRRSWGRWRAAHRGRVVASCWAHRGLATVGRYSAGRCSRETCHRGAVETARASLCPLARLHPRERRRHSAPACR